MKKVWMIGCLLMSGVLLTGCRQMDTKQNTKETMQANSEEMQEAETTPYGKYPELVTYTLGKMSGENNSNMPDGDTYEDNAYTRYLRDMLNVQNKDVFEASDNEYDDIVSMAIETNDIPDIIERFKHLEQEADRKRTEKSFMVPKEDIVNNEYDLSINKYKEVEYIPVENPPTSEIMANIHELEMEIGKNLAVLEELLGL